MNSLGVDVGGTFAKLALVSRSGRVLKSTQIPTEPRAGAAAFVKRVKAVTKGWSYGRVGMALAGGVDHDKGTLLFVPNLPGWTGYPFKKAFGVPTTVENDANAAAWAAARGQKSAVVITLGTGVGGGIIIGGRLWRGATGSAAEIGHMVIEVGGEVCGCGRHGCLEAYCGTAGIQRIAGTRVLPKDLADAAHKGDRAAQDVWEQVGTRLGEGIANLVLILNPEAVYILGGVARAGELLLKPARRVLDAQPFRRPFEKLKLLAPADRDWGALGAALLAFEEAGR
jgi:glucokinase